MTLDEDCLIPSNLKQERCVTEATASGALLKTMADYSVVREIGEGSFSVVYSAKEKSPPNRDVAIKMCFKRQILKEKRVASVHREKQILAKLSSPDHQHPCIVALHATFQDAQHLYFVLSYAKHGDLLHVMLKLPDKKFTLDKSRFYSAELLSAIQHLHVLSIIHRDIKPENILVAESGHILLSDFGSVRDLSETEGAVPQQSVGRVRRNSFVGTAQYVSPEVLTGSDVSAATDLWSFAVVVFQFLTGKHCFHDESEYLMYKGIQKLLYTFPDDFPSEAKDLVEKLLVIEPQDRLGTSSTGGPTSLRQHPFFAGIDWDKLTKMDVPP